MKQPNPHINDTYLFVRRASLLFGLLLVVVLALADRAAAAYEQPPGAEGVFAGVLGPAPSEFPEDVQLGGLGAMAVNVSGAGGVAAGTVYAVAKGTVGDQVQVARYTPVSNGTNTTLEFREAWEVAIGEGPYFRCGPDSPSSTPCPARPNGKPANAGIAVDQATGNVFVLTTELLSAGAKAIREYSPDGTVQLDRFGEIANFGETTASSAAKLHSSPFPGGIAVDSAGTVYVFDLNSPDNFYHRLMVFKPGGGGYEYAGMPNDIGAGFFGSGRYPSGPVVDAAGNIFVAPEESFIQKYEPATQKSSPVCSFELATGGITAMTVDPVTDKVFYYSYKDKRVHQLSACNAQGKFTELPPPSTVKPERNDLFALAFDPNRHFSPSREAGILYGGTPSSTPSTGGKGEPGQSALGYIFVPVKEDPPVVESETVSRVTAATAAVHAVVDPKGSEASYVFQYLTEPEFIENGNTFAGSTEAPLGGAVAGSGQGGLDVAAVLSGLAPETKYRFRVVATSHCSVSQPNKVCEDVGSGETFRTYPVEAAGLPDRRVYERVSPANKNGGQVFPADPLLNSCGSFKECKPGAAYQHFPMQSAPSGDAVVYEGSPFSASEGAVIENQYLGHRTLSGWVSTNLTPPNLLSKAEKGYKAFDATLSRGVLEQTSPSLSAVAPQDFTNLYLQDTTAPAAVIPLLSEDPLNYLPPLHRVSGTGANHLQTNYAGASADFSQVFFEVNDALTGVTPSAPKAADGGENKRNLYEWAAGQLRLVNVAPGNSVTTPGASYGSGTLLRSGNGNLPSAVVTHAISSDGSRALWTAASGQLFARVDGDRTVEIPSPGNCNEGTPLASRVCFLTAAEDGATVMLSNGQVYELNEEAEAYEAATDLGAGKAGFAGIAGQAEDLSNVYFVDTEALAANKNSQGDKAIVGKPNLYWWNGSTTVFVATLLMTDAEAWAAAPSVRTAEASPDGRWVTFLSSASLTGYNNVGPCFEISGTDKFVDAACNEVYLYDSSTNTLTCPSCNQSEAPPLGGSVLRLFRNVKGSLPQPRYLSNSGRLVFDSQDALTPRDTNGRVEDVYQFEPNGVGNCARETGCVSLISGGREGVDSNFMAMDPSGDNVFFTSHDRLVPSDTDELVDLYDARVDGGFASEAGLPPTECQGEACQPPSLPPAEPTPSPPPAGAGNFKACKKGQVKKEGRCVKRPRHKKHHGKQSHSKGTKSSRGGK